MSCEICHNEIIYNGRNQYGKSKTCGAKCRERRKSYLKGVGWTLFAKCNICKALAGELCTNSDGDILVPCDGRERKLIVKKCKQCNQRFNTRSHNTKCCSDKCRADIRKVKKY